MSSATRSIAVITKSSLFHRVSSDSKCIDFVFDALGDKLLREWLKIGLTFEDATYYIYLVHCLQFITRGPLQESYREMVQASMAKTLDVPLGWMDRRSLLFYEKDVAEKRKMPFIALNRYYKYSNRHISYCHPTWNEEEIAERLLKLQQ